MERLDEAAFTSIQFNANINNNNNNNNSTGGGGGGQQQQQQQQPQIDTNQRPAYTIPGILHYLQHEWTRFEYDRQQWEADKAELLVNQQDFSSFPIY